MTEELRPVVILPARLASSRFPRKLVSPLRGEALIKHALNSAIEAFPSTSVYVAYPKEDVEFDYHVPRNHAIRTSSRPRNGTERCAEAVGIIDPDGTRFDVVVNVQPDMPHFGHDIARVLEPIAAGADMATLGAEFGDHTEQNENTVRLLGSRCVVDTFTRRPSNQCWLHVGVYAYRRGTLSMYASTEPGFLELDQKLEQLRLLEEEWALPQPRSSWMRFATIDHYPPSINTPEDMDALYGT